MPAPRPGPPPWPRRRGPSPWPARGALRDGPGRPAAPGRGLNEATLVMALLRPGIGEENLHPIKRTGLEKALERGHHVALKHAHVGEVLILKGRHERAHARGVHLNPKEATLRLRRRHGRQGPPHAKANLEGHGSSLGEALIPVVGRERSFGPGNSEAFREPGSSPSLAWGFPPGA